MNIFGCGDRNEAQRGPERVAVCCRGELETNTCVSWEEYAHSPAEEAEGVAVSAPTVDVKE